VFKRSEVFDVSLYFLSRPIRHQSQISGFRNQWTGRGDDEDYERETPPPSDIDGCDWDALSVSFMT
jgi:hypothetical protein